MIHKYMVTGSKKYIAVEEPLYKFKQKLSENKDNIALIEIKFEETFPKTSQQNTELYLFKPKLLPVDAIDDIIAVHTEKYFMKSEFTWGNNVDKPIQIQKTLFHNYETLENPDKKQKFWTGMQLYTGKEFNEFLEKRLSNDIGFKKRYSTLLNMLSKGL